MSFSLGFFERTREQMIDDVTDVVTGYVRTQRILGGDVVARFQIQGSKSYLEYVFFQMLGKRFVESGFGHIVFDGYVHTMRYSDGGDVIARSLAGVYNWVAVEYRPNSSTPKAVTAITADSDSVQRYGVRQTIIRPQAYLTPAQAILLRDEQLGRLAEPRAGIESLAETISTTQNRLEIEVRGWYDTLDVSLFSLPPGTVSLSSHIATVANGGDVVVGDIVGNGSLVEQEAVNITRWSRLKTYYQNEIGGFFFYQLGCFGGRVIVYDNIRPDRIDYLRYDGRIMDEDNNAIPPQLVTAGKMILSPTILASQIAIGGPYNDPRRALIEEVTYRHDTQSVAIRVTGLTSKIASLRLGLGL